MKLDPLFQNVIDGTFRQFGAAVTLRRTEKGYDPISGGTTVISQTDYTPPASPPAQYSQDMIAKGLVSQTDLKVSLSAKSLPVVPSLGYTNSAGNTVTDTILFEGDEYPIKLITPHYAGDEVAMYELQVGK